MNHRAIAYPLCRELRGKTYAKVLEYSLKSCRYGCVFYRTSLSFSKEARECFDLLREWEVPEFKEIPFSDILDANAQILFFHWKMETLDLILKYSQKLYAWQQPFLPEDLCLYLEDGREWLVTTAHKRSGYLILEKEEYYEIIKEINVLKNTLQGLLKVS